MSKKYQRIQRKETRRVLQQYLTDIIKYLKPKPKYMPWWMWEWMQSRVINMAMIDPIVKLKRGKESQD